MTYKYKKIGYINYHTFGAFVQKMGQAFIRDAESFEKAYEWVCKNHAQAIGVANPLANSYDVTVGVIPTIKYTRSNIAEAFVQCICAIIFPEYQSYLTSTTRDKGIDVLIKNGKECIMAIDTKTGKSRKWKTLSDNRVFLSKISEGKGIGRYVVFFDSDEILELPPGDVLRNDKKIKEFAYTLGDFVGILLSSLSEEDCRKAIDEIKYLNQYLEKASL